MVTFWAYLHTLGFSHNDLFQILSHQSYTQDLGILTQEVSLEMLHAIFHSIPITNERKSRIHSAFLQETYANFGERIARMHIEILLHSDARFPKELHDIPNTPFLIYVQGHLETAGIKMAMVGSRESTPYGEQIVKSFVPKLVQAGISIVSGGALGIDALAHESAMGVGGHTLVVFGSGIDQPYPKSHRHLFEKVVISGGAIISHFPIGMVAAPYTFPQRNEIIAGLSRGVIVVEAKEKSGSLITAQLALEMGKDVFAVPSDVSRRNSLGCNRLIQNASAKLLLSPDDILEEYGLFEILGLKNHVSETTPKNTLEKNILILLDGNTLAIEEMEKSLGVDARELQIELGKMEIYGTIKRNISGQYSLLHV